MIVCLQYPGVVCDTECRTMGCKAAELHKIEHRVNSDHAIIVGSRQTLLLIADKSMRKPDLLTFEIHVLQKTKGVRISKGSVLAEVPNVIGPLFIISATRYAVISRINPAFVIDLHVERVSSAFCKYFKNM